MIKLHLLRSRRLQAYTGLLFEDILEVILKDIGTNAVEDAPLFHIHLEEDGSTRSLFFC